MNKPKLYAYVYRMGNRSVRGRIHNCYNYRQAQEALEEIINKSEYASSLDMWNNKRWHVDWFQLTEIQDAKKIIRTATRDKRLTSRSRYILNGLGVGFMFATIISVIIAILMHK